MPSIGRNVNSPAAPQSANRRRIDGAKQRGEEQTGHRARGKRHPRMAAAVVGGLFVWQRDQPVDAIGAPAGMLAGE